MPSTLAYKSPTPLALISGTGLFDSDDIDGTAVAVATANARVLLLIVDNTANTGSTCCIKLYNVAVGSVTVGTTVPWFFWEVPAGARLVMAFPNGLPQQANISAACVTTNGTAGTTSPSNNVTCRIHYAT